MVLDLIQNKIYISFHKRFDAAVRKSICQQRIFR